MEFKYKNRQGKVGESLAIEWLQNRNWVVIDTSAHKFFQRNGIDLVCTNSETKKVVCADVKWDQNDSGNFFIETISNSNTNSPGAIYQTQADYWLYGIAPKNTFFVFSPAAMRKHIETHQYPERYATTTGYDGTPLYKSIGVLVPLKNAPIVQTIKEHQML